MNVLFKCENEVENYFFLESLAEFPECPTK